MFAGEGEAEHVSQRRDGSVTRVIWAKDKMVRWKEENTKKGKEKKAKIGCKESCSK